MQCRKHGLAGSLEKIYGQCADFGQQVFTKQQKCDIIILMTAEQLQNALIY